MKFKRVLIFTMFVFTDSVWASLCSKWSEPKVLGQLDTKSVSEASGVTSSHRFANRLYWINDSGDHNHIYVSREDGSDVKTLAVGDFSAADSEALTLAKCPEGECLIIGDIGDNKEKRPEIKLAVVEEPSELTDSAKLIREIHLIYPDHAHNAEAMAILPNGDLLIFTKELNTLETSAKTSQVYRLPAKGLNVKDKHKQRLQHFGSVPLPDMRPDAAAGGQAITDAAFDGKRKVLGLLTYQGALEIPLAKLKSLKDTKKWKEHVDYDWVPIKSLAQEETITYSKDGRLIWSSEAAPPSTPVYSMECQAFKK